MGESNREAETRGEESESESEADADASASASASASVFPKEPSFSMWSRSRADAVTIVVGGPGSSLEEPDLSELPLLGGGSEAGAQRSSTPILIVNGDEIRHPPFDIETGLAKIGSPEESSSGNTISGVVVLKTLFCILAWYTFSTCLTVYNKKLLGENMGKFPAPMMMNTVHFTMQAVLSKAIVCFQSRGAESSVKMTWRDYFLRVVPTALGSALDINLSNASLVFISVTFATMCKSAAPIFLLLFAFAFRLERPSFKLIGIIIIISIGVLLTVAKETEFEFWGFVFVMLAAVMSGFRWCMTQLLLQREAFGLQNPIVLMSYVTPVMAVATAILSLTTDPWGNFTQSSYFDSSLHILQSSLLMLLGGALAFFMVLTEYILVSATSAVTVTVAGIVKEAVTIMVAVYYFHDKFTLLKGFGLFTIMVGVSLFNWYKYNKLKKEKSSDYKHTHHASPTEVPKYVILDEDFHDVN